MSGLQNWPDDLHPSSHGRSTRLFAAARVRRFFMTAMTIHSIQSRPHRSAPAGRQEILVWDRPPLSPDQTPNTRFELSRPRARPSAEGLLRCHPHFRVFAKSGPPFNPHSSEPGSVQRILSAVPATELLIRSSKLARAGTTDRMLFVIGSLLRE